MVRSLYSGVAGMTTHQTKMDVIGNNISNVSTYGYKSSRAAFKDVYYQTNNTAMSATPTSGGTNPTQIGYGAKLGSVDVNHSQSVMSNTGYTLDVAIAGEGYLQVMDADGNIFYTKAGMLDIDAEGNLVDINGYFVLGVSGQPTGQNPGSNRIKVSLPYESAAAAKAEDTINDIGYTVEAENQNADGNVNIVFQTSTNMPFGQRMSASITSASIIVTVNSNEYFTDMADFNAEMNLAITSANGGVRHKAGDFTISSTVPDSDLFADPDDPTKTKPLTGAEIVEPDFGVNTGSVTFSNDLKTYFGVKSVGDEFEGWTGNETFALNMSATDPNGQTAVSFTIGDYVGYVPLTNMKAGSVLMKNTAAGASSADSFVMTYPNLGTLSLPTGISMDVTSVASEPSRNLGLANANFLLKGGTEGGEQTVADLTGISINDKGVLIAEHPTLGSLELGRIDLATFANPAGLSQVGDTYFAESRNSGEPIIAVAGTEGTGDILGGTLETSNTDLAHEMADMIVTQRGFQACSRMITVSDSMLEELINLKR
ncbi:MAG: flagellar hook-basal body complex protein [Clostridium sp.]|nr:flagellar hook-basal body complex protein [Clostridium sp.]MCM1547566.1 flagellar hook-basal body complex protein [Ruminococcus sp.]